MEAGVRRGAAQPYECRRQPFGGAGWFCSPNKIERRYLVRSPGLPELSCGIRPAADMMVGERGRVREASAKTRALANLHRAARGSDDTSDDTMHGSDA